MCIRYNNQDNGGSFIHQPTKKEPVQGQQSEDSSTHCATTGTSDDLSTQCTQQPFCRKQRDDCLNEKIRQLAILFRCGEEVNLKSVTKSNLADNKLPDSNLVDNKLPDSNLVDNKLPDSKLVDNKLPDSKLVDNKLPDSNLVDNKLPDSKLVDNKLPDSKLVDNKLPDSNLVDNKLPDSNLVDNKLPDSKLVDNKLPDSKLVDNKLPDSKLVDNKLPDSNLVDNKLPDSNLVDSNLVDNKLPDSNLVDSSLIDSSLIEFAEESLLAQGSLKVKSAANKTTGNGGGSKKQTKQSSRRHGKKVATRSVVGRSSGARNVGGGSDDDDGEGRKPRKSGQDKKQPGCEGQALPKKKRQAKDKTQRRSPSPTAKTPGEGGSRNPLPPGARSKQPGRGLRGVVAADVLPAGARLKQTGRGLEGVTGATVSKDGRLQIGGSDSEKHPHSSSSLNQSMCRMSLGGAANQANVDPGGDVERSNLKASVLDRFLSGLKNVEAFERLFKDEGIKAPLELAAGGFNSLPDEALAGGAVSEPRLGRASASSEAPHALELSEVEPEVEVPLSVVYGQPADLVAYVEDLQGHLSHEAKQGLHDGVILCEDLGIEDGKYAEGTQYTKLKVLGRGSFGKVFLIRDKTAGRNIVGKEVVWDKFAPNEALVWCGLEHPNIVPLLGLVRTGVTVVFLSEYHQGVQTLQQLVNERVLGQGRALHLIKQLFHTLKYLHDRRIVHNDVSPDNILVLNNHIWLIDFGRAMWLTAPQHGDDDLKGTECYMAPEIAGSQNERMDIWNALRMLILANITPREGPMEDVPATADSQFIEWGLQKDYLSLPTAAQVLEKFPSQIVRDELYNTLAIGNEPETEPEPEEEYQPLAANPRPGGPGEGGPDSLEMDDLFEARLLSACAEMEDEAACAEMEDEEEEDVYGPSSSSEDTDGPEVFHEGAFGRHDSESASSKTSRPMAAGLANRSGPPSGRVHGISVGARQNSMHNFMHDQSRVGDEHPSGRKALSGLDKAMPSESFELDVGFLSQLGSSKCESGSLTEFANMLDAGALPSANEAHPQDEPDMAAAAVGRVVGVAVTSGIGSSSPRDSTEESRPYDSPGERLQRTNTVPSGIHVTIYMANVEPFRIKIPNTDFSARDLAKQIVRLPNYVNADASLNSFTLCLRGSHKAVGHKYTFGPGEHELDVVEASEGVNWLWRIDSSGQITIAN